MVAGLAAAEVYEPSNVLPLSPLFGGAALKRALMLGLLFAGCVPHRDVPLEEIPKITKLADLMAAQSTIADPQFKKIGQASYTDADFVAFVDVGKRISATSAHIKDFSKGPGFDELAAQLGRNADALASAGTAHDPVQASAALKEMKTTCKTCHSKYR